MAPPSMLHLIFASQCTVWLCMFDSCYSNQLYVQETPNLNTFAKSAVFLKVRVFLYALGRFK